MKIKQKIEIDGEWSYLAPTVFDRRREDKKEYGGDMNPAVTDTVIRLPHNL